MGIVRDYEKQGLSKVAAVKSILATFSESAEYKHTPPDQIEAAVDTYIAMLDQHDNTQSHAAVRGETSGGSNNACGTNEGEQQLVLAPSDVPGWASSPEPAEPSPFKP